MVKKTLNRKRIRFKTVIIFILLAGAAYYFFLGGNGYLKLRRMNNEIERLRAEHDSLQLEIDSVKSAIKALRKGDKETIEFYAREWQLVKPGEDIILIEIDSSGYNKNED